MDLVRRLKKQSPSQTADWLRRLDKIFEFPLPPAIISSQPTAFTPLSRSLLGLSALLRGRVHSVVAARHDSRTLSYRSGSWVIGPCQNPSISHNTKTLRDQDEDMHGWQLQRARRPPDTAQNWL
jgi:hypothetical protein